MSKRMPSAAQRAGKTVSAGDILAGRDIISLSGGVLVPDAERIVHLQFRRFAGCPVCNLHLRSFARRHDEIAAAGIREIVVFHSTAEELMPHVADLPFEVIADPDKRLYREFGVESSPRSLLDPRVWGTIVRAIAHSLVGIARDGRPAPSLNPRGGRFGLPADFLIEPSGRVLACKYGVHADDQWSVDEMLALARDARGPAGVRETGARPFTVGSDSYNVPSPMSRRPKTRTINPKTPRRGAAGGCAR